MNSNNIFFEIDKTIFNCLNQNQMFKDYKIPVYFSVPNGTNFPYIHIGKTNLINTSPKNARLYKIYKEINIFSKNNGNRELALIFEEVFKSLSREIQASLESYNNDIKAEGNIYHLSSKFKFYLEV